MAVGEQIEEAVVEWFLNGDPLTYELVLNQPETANWQLQPFITLNSSCACIQGAFVHILSRMDLFFCWRGWKWRDLLFASGAPTIAHLGRWSFLVVASSQLHRGWKLMSNLSSEKIVGLGGAVVQVDVVVWAPSVDLASSGFLMANNSVGVGVYPSIPRPPYAANQFPMLSTVSLTRGWNDLTVPIGELSVPVEMMTISWCGLKGEEIGDWFQLSFVNFSDSNRFVNAGNGSSLSPGENSTVFNLTATASSPLNSGAATIAIQALLMQEMPSMLVVVKISVVPSPFLEQREFVLLLLSVEMPFSSTLYTLEPNLAAAPSRTIDVSTAFAIPLDILFSIGPATMGASGNESASFNSSSYPPPNITLSLSHVESAPNSINGLPDWMQFNSSTNVLHGTTPPLPTSDKILIAAFSDDYGFYTTFGLGGPFLLLFMTLVELIVVELPFRNPILASLWLVLIVVGKRWWCELWLTLSFTPDSVPFVFARCT